MKIYKVTLLVIDHDKLGADQVSEVLERTRYPNRCINPRVMDIETRDVEWDDDHPLNCLDTQKVAYTKLFRVAKIREKTIRELIEWGEDIKRLIQLVKSYLGEKGPN